MSEQDLTDSAMMESSPAFGVKDDHLIILYVTFAIIIGLLLIWLIIITVTKEDPLKILNEMNNLAAQMAPASDTPTIPTPFESTPSNPTPFIPSDIDYVDTLIELPMDVPI